MAHSLSVDRSQRAAAALGARVIERERRGRTLEDVRDWPQRIDAVTGEQVRTAAQAVLTAAGSVTGVLVGRDGLRDGTSSVKRKETR